MVLTLLGFMILLSCSKEKLDTVTLHVDEMCCQECQKLVQTTILAQPGIKELSLNYETHEAVITIRPDQVSPQHLTKVLLEKGFTVNGTAGDSTAFQALPAPCRE